MLRFFRIPMRTATSLPVKNLIRSKATVPQLQLDVRKFQQPSARSSDLFQPKKSSKISIIPLNSTKRKTPTLSSDRVKTLGPTLYTLKEIAKKAKSLPNSPNFKDVIFVLGQHLLSTTISLIEFLIEMGASSKNIFIIGKNYSNNKEVIAALKEMNIYVQPNSEQFTLGGFSSAYAADISNLWEKSYNLMLEKIHKREPIAGIIVLDDGGGLSLSMPVKVKELLVKKSKEDKKASAIDIVFIEQTSSGIASTNSVPCPVIEVATSALKQWIEPIHVAAKCVEEIEKSLVRLRAKHNDLCIPPKPTFGIIGLGRIGCAMLNQLVQAGYRDFVILDKNTEKADDIEAEFKEKGINVNSVYELGDLYFGSDVILGNTGKDHMVNILRSLKIIKSPKILISCSSRDEEYKTLLLHIQENKKDSSVSSLEDIRYKNGFGADLILVRGGTPIGFTNDKDSVNPKIIEVIRGIKAAAAIQAYYMLKSGHKEAKKYMVDPRWQSLVFTKWMESQPPVIFSSKELDKYKNPEEIAANSRGKIYIFNDHHPLDLIEDTELQSEHRFKIA